MMPSGRNMSGVEHMISLLLNEQAEQMPGQLLLLMTTCMESTLAMEEFPYEAEISLSVTDDEGIRALNREQRGIDKATDVLSFPMLETEDGVLIVEDADITEGRIFLGDIVISLPRAEAQAVAYGHSLDRELGFLTVHSLLHLLGYDHEKGAREESEMFQKQEAVLEAIGLTR